MNELIQISKITDIEFRIFVIAFLPPPSSRNFKKGLFGAEIFTVKFEQIN